MLQPATVLLVEDDESDLFLLQRAFTKARSANPLQIVRNGEEAISYMDGSAPFSNRTRFPLPAVVLLDLKMPRRNGFEVLQWIRCQPALQRLVVVVLTCCNESSEINRSYELGANSYLVKPSDLEGWLELVQTMQCYWLLLNQTPELKASSLSN